ncbi:thioredoxin family protein [Aquimarina pacifica]|uniref:thioredoxin family protein n=1 Tax=Aquimarina pacifica TaxID=1296415 RepID=UPI000470AD25|nr:thioredoxin family protein [Aquimarina pacifica]
MNPKVLLVQVILSIFFCYTAVAQDWKYDFEEAVLLAQKNEKNIVLLFTGSDWCPPCIKLEKNILSSDEFLSYAEQNFIWVKADFPRRKKNKLSEIQQKKNEALANRYNKKWRFPVILVLNQEGQVMGATGYRRDLTVKGYISLLTQFNSFEN